MSYTTIYYYGLLFSFMCNLFILYANVYHNDDVNQKHYKNMTIMHCILLLTSWLSIIVFLVMMFIEKDNNKKPRRKR